jgi:hypothetical protein
MRDINPNGILLPEVDGKWWSIATNPDLVKYSREKQQPLDFDIWQASDGMWQLVSCCRNTGCGGKGRLFFRWQSDSLTDTNWKEMGVFMEADANCGETIGGLQAPNVIKNDGQYFMFYGDWNHICAAISNDGKSFERLTDDNGQSGIFNEGDGPGTRDPHVMSFNKKFYIYYTGIVDKNSAIYCRISNDLRTWSDSVIVNSGGSGGSGPSDAECPYVIYMKNEQIFYLFRTHKRQNSDEYQTSIYCSRDPLNFGIDTDNFKVSSMQAECIRLVRHEKKFYIAALKPDLTGMMMARLEWHRHRPDNH